MSKFISEKNPHYYPKPGDHVRGQSGKRVCYGVVIASKKDPRKPAIFSRYGYVGLLIMTDRGKIVAINEVEVL